MISLRVNSAIPATSSKIQSNWATFDHVRLDFALDGYIQFGLVLENTGGIIVIFLLLQTSINIKKVRLS